MTPDAQHFTCIETTGWSRWSRIKLATAMVLTPLTLVLFGRSIRVRTPDAEIALTEPEPDEGEQS